MPATATRKARLAIIEITDAGETALHTVPVNDTEPDVAVERAEALRVRYAASGNVVEVRPYTTVA